MWVKELGSLPQQLAPPEMLQVRSLPPRHACGMSRDKGLQPALQELAKDFEEEEEEEEEEALDESDDDCGDPDDDGDWNLGA